MERKKDHVTLISGASFGRKQRLKLTAHVGFWHPGNGAAQLPHFSVTGTVERQNRRPNEDIIAGGCLHDEIRKHFPELAGLIRWHLCDDDGVPMHHEANAAFWAQTAAGCSEWERRPYDPDPVETFKSTVVFGAVDGDTMPNLTVPDSVVDEADPRMLSVRERGTIGWRKIVSRGLVTDVYAWCRARLPALKAAFARDITAAGLDELRLTHDHCKT